VSDTEHWPYEHAEPEKLSARLADNLAEHGVFISKRAQDGMTLILAAEIHCLLKEIRSERDRPRECT